MLTNYGQLELFNHWQEFYQVQNSINLTLTQTDIHCFRSHLYNCLGRWTGWWLTLRSVVARWFFKCRLRILSRASYYRLKLPMWQSVITQVKWAICSSTGTDIWWPKHIWSASRKYISYWNVSVSIFHYKELFL